MGWCLLTAHHDLDFLVYAFGIPKDKVVFRAKRSDSDFLNITYDFGDFFVQTQASWYATKDHPFTACYSFQFEDALVDSAKSVSRFICVTAV